MDFAAAEACTGLQSSKPGALRRGIIDGSHVDAGPNKTQNRALIFNEWLINRKGMGDAYWSDNLWPKELRNKRAIVVWEEEGWKTIDRICWWQRSSNELLKLGAWRVLLDGADLEIYSK
jgi:hypothetical protein